MAEVYVKNSLNPYKIIKVGISFTQVVNYNDYEGELIWVIEIGTVEPHKNGGKIAPTYINLLTLKDLDSEIDKAVSFISAQVDWGDLEVDLVSPNLTLVSPRGSIVSMNTVLEFILKEDLPSAGIDIDTINVKVNGIDVSEDLKVYGNPFEYRVFWTPKIKVFDTY